MKAQYAILRFAKYKGPEIGHIESHNERTKPAIPILTPHAATLTSIWYPRNANTVRRPKSKLLKQAAAPVPTACA